DDAALVRVLERLRHLQQDPNDLEVAGASQAAQITTGRELHRQHDGIIRSLGRKYLEDGGVIELTGDRVLVLERRPGALITRKLGAQNLERDVDATHVVVCAPDFALTAGAQPLELPVAAGQALSIDRSRSLCHGLTWLTPCALPGLMRRFKRHGLRRRRGRAGRGFGLHPGTGPGAGP